MAGTKAGGNAKKPTIFSLVIPYKGIILLLIFLTLVGNGVNLVIPKIISHGIDSYSNGNFILKSLVLQFFRCCFCDFCIYLPAECCSNLCLGKSCKRYKVEAVSENLQAELCLRDE